MKWEGWEKVPLAVTNPDNPLRNAPVEAIAPLIVSASRSTDIPAFYGDWFMERFRKGYVKWRSPFGGNPVYVSFEKTRLIVFWSKNPAPFLPYLKTLDELGLGYYVLFTLNDYEDEGLEPHVPPLKERIGTFLKVSKKAGPGRVVWRFDPLVLSDRITVDDLLDRIKKIGDRVHPFTRRMIFSFVDIEKYAKVKRNLRQQGFSDIREFSEHEISTFCSGLEGLNRSWGLIITACSERRDLSRYGIGRGQCISADLIDEEFSYDPVLMDFLHPPGQQTLPGSSSPGDPLRRLKDPGQRNTCRCIVSKDIGQYSTCMHLCAYCYANASPALVHRHYRHYCTEKDKGIYRDTITG